MTRNLELLKIVEYEPELSTLENLPQKVTNKREAEPRSRETDYLSNIKHLDPAMRKANYPHDFSIM